MNNCAKLFWNTCINVLVIAQTSSIYDHFIIEPLSVTLTFSLPEQRFQKALLLLDDNNCAKLFWNLCKNIQVMAQTNLDRHMHNTRTHIHRTEFVTTILSFDLQVWPWPLTYLNNCFRWTATPQGEQLCQIIVKSMHNCRSYGGCMYAHTHTHTLKWNYNNYVSLTSSGPDKNSFCTSVQAYFCP